MNPKADSEPPSERHLLREILKAVEAVREMLANWPEPPKATFVGGAASAIPKGAAMSQVEKLDYKSDLEDALLVDSPNGPVDGVSRWAGTDNADGSDLGPRLEVETGGHRAIARLPTDAASFDFTVTETYDVDNPQTPEIETISTTYHLGGVHSKATDPGGAASALVKGAGFP